VKRIGRDERGAALVLAIVFMLVLGSISAAGLSLLASGLHSRVGLDVVRNRQYAADAGVEAAIVAARPAVTTWATDTYAAYAVDPQTAGNAFLSSAGCGGARTSSLNSVKITVDCFPAPALHAGYFEFNVIFSAACTNCSTSTPIVHAQINYDFDVQGGTVKSTYVQSWSVNT
jgi:hypothetical protein